jgi:hypothetical protein
VTAVGTGGVTHSVFVPLLYAYTNKFHQRTIVRFFKCHCHKFCTSEPIGRESSSEKVTKIGSGHSHAVESEVTSNGQNNINAAAAAAREISVPLNNNFGLPVAGRGQTPSGTIFNKSPSGEGRRVLLISGETTSSNHPVRTLFKTSAPLIGVLSPSLITVDSHNYSPITQSQLQVPPMPHPLNDGVSVTSHVLSPTLSTLRSNPFNSAPFVHGTGRTLTRVQISTSAVPIASLIQPTLFAISNPYIA